MIDITPRVNEQPKRFFLDRDDSGHWYIVEADHRMDWNRWRQLDEADDSDDPVNWELPAYAKEIGCDPCWVEFIEYEVTV